MSSGIHPSAESGVLRVVFAISDEDCRLASPSSTGAGLREERPPAKYYQGDIEFDTHTFINRNDRSQQNILLYWGYTYNVCVLCQMSNFVVRAGSMQCAVFEQGACIVLCLSREHAVCCV